MDAITLEDVTICMPYYHHHKKLIERVLESYEKMGYMKAGVWLSISKEPADQQHPLNPSSNRNKAVREAKTRFIYLTQPDIIHTQPFLFLMKRVWWELEDDDHPAVIISNMWDDRRNCWINHEEHHFNPATPSNFMLRELYLDVGGNDEGYRMCGHGAEDIDFMILMHKAGARYHFLPGSAFEKDDAPSPMCRHLAHPKNRWRGRPNASERFRRKWGMSFQQAMMRTRKTGGLDWIDEMKLEARECIDPDTNPT